VHVTRHAVDRYLERRSTTLSREQIAEKLIDMLASYSGPLPSVRSIGDSGPGRRFVIGEIVLITNAEVDTIITVYRQPRGSAARKARRRARRGVV
jgi:hypothetical protein